MRISFFFTIFAAQFARVGACLYARKCKNMKENNFCVIMAGGIGSRFWPFSTNEKPKQFLDFFGTGRSLIQMTVDRFRPLVPINNVLIVTNIAYREMILEQIPDLPVENILCEPARRNTAPCIAYATARIRAMVNEQRTKEQGQRTANIVVAPSDHLILNEAEFLRVVQEGFDFVEQNDALLTLGMKPTRPETGYGYIQKLKVESLKFKEVVKVKQFKEKPDLETAKQYVAAGDYLWNSGLFIWSLKSIENALSEHLPEVASIFAKGEKLMGTEQETAFIQEYFPQCPNISIDYGVMEKAKDVYVLPADFGWSDLGTWGSLHELSEKDADGNVATHCNAKFYNAHGNIVAVEEKVQSTIHNSPSGAQSTKYVVVEGVDDMIVAQSGDVLLVCKKQDEQQIREFVKDYELFKL